MARAHYEIRTTIMYNNAEKEGDRGRCNNLIIYVTELLFCRRQRQTLAHVVGYEQMGNVIIYELTLTLTCCIQKAEKDQV